ncbi:MAG: hypothetical protein BRD45_00110 [Bacteroidetes bacterium QS_8_64_10]|nr:MAG: hypothetical protein BRD45_00110 [Bacteroidetes bacterium QS_8_64_10]
MKISARTRALIPKLLAQYIKYLERPDYMLHATTRIEAQAREKRFRSLSPLTFVFEIGSNCATALLAFGYLFGYGRQTVTGIHSMLLAATGAPCQSVTPPADRQRERSVRNFNALSRIR